jgi:hypothetical protein
MLGYMYPTLVHYALGPWLDQDASKIDDPWGAPDDSDFIYFNPFATNDEYYIDFSLAPSPVQITNIMVKLWIRAWCRSHNAVTVDHRLWGYLSIGGVRYDHATPIDITGTTNAQGDNPQWYTYDFGGTNPALGSSWLLPHFPGLCAGGHFKVLTDPTASSTPYCKPSNLILEIAGDPLTGNVEGIRSVLSPVLRTFRKKKRYFMIHGRPELFDAPILGRLSATHRKAPSVDGGWGIKPWERGNLIVLESTVQPDDTVVLRCMDTEDFDTVLWTPLYTDLTASPSDLSGIARVDLGGGLNYTARGEVAYVPRPLDALYNEVGLTQMKIGRDGLHVESSALENLVFNSSFSQGSSNTFTSWVPTTGSGTGGSITQDKVDILLDAENKRRSALLVGGSTGETFLSQAMSVANDPFRVAIWYKAGATSLRWRLQRSSDSKYWNDAAGTWDVADPGNYLADTGGVIPADCFRSKLITASGAVTYTLLLIATVSNKSGHFYEVELLHETSVSVPTDVITRCPLVTTTVKVARTGDNPFFGNDAGKRVWDPESGRAYFEFRPDWSHADLLDGRYIAVLSAFLGVGYGVEYGAGSLGNVVSPTVDMIFYVRDSSTAGRWVFRRFTTGRIGATWYDAYVDVTSGAGTLPTRGTWVRLAARWASLAGEWGMGLRGTSLWIDPGSGTLLKGSQSGNPVPDAQMVEWAVAGSGVANVAIDSLLIKKTSGATGTWNAGSYSVQQLASGDGYVEHVLDTFTASPVAVGFNSNPTVDANYTGIDFCIMADAGSCKVYENGSLKYTGASEALAGDVLRVQIEGGGTVVKYYSNGVLKYTAVTPTITYPLSADCSIFNTNGVILGATMGGTVAADGTRRLSGAVNPRMPQSAYSSVFLRHLPGGTQVTPTSGTFRKLDFSRRPGSDAALTRLMKW